MILLKCERIFLYDQERELLIFLLLANLLEDKITYVTYKTKENMLEKLEGRKIIIDDNDTISKIKIFNRIKMGLYIKRLRKREKEILKKIQEEKAKLYGVDFLALGKRIFFKEKLYMIEEGTATYTRLIEEKSFKGILIKIFNKFLFLEERENIYGYGEKVKKIYLTENLCKEIPKGLEKKAEIINLKELWNKKSEEEKRIILDTFNFNDEILKKVDENTIMLFTQPLSEDNVITEEEKVELYSKILKKYDNQSIIIKPHPREKTDYSKYFSSCYVMKERYPVEILELVGINIKKSVTIFSSAAFGLGKNIEIDFYGTEINDKIFKRFGNHDNVMKRNAFLD